MLKRVMYAAIVLVIILSMISGCKKNDLEQSGAPAFTSYKNIPRVTEAERNAIEALKSEYDSFTYGMPLSIEAFTDRNNDIRGFSALFCEWLSGLFGIEFVPALYEWVELIALLESGEVDFTQIQCLSTAEARQKLLAIKGVGPKVCDCVLLFGANKTDAFPVDVWMDRALRFYYDQDKSFDSSVFGEFSGIAQQYLFYYARENKIGKTK